MYNYIRTYIFLFFCTSLAYYLRNKTQFISRGKIEIFFLLNLIYYIFLKWRYFKRSYILLVTYAYDKLTKVHYSNIYQIHTKMVDGLIILIFKKKLFDILKLHVWLNIIARYSILHKTTIYRNTENVYHCANLKKKWKVKNLILI